MGDKNVNWSASIQPPSVQIVELEVVPSSDVVSDSEVRVLSEGNVSHNISKEELINFNPVGVWT